MIRRLCFVLLASSFIVCLVLSQDYPTYSESDLPETGFSCDDKVHGAFYADIETDCQMYHICMHEKGGKMKSTQFLCGNGTVFDQRRLVCQDYRKVQHCYDSGKYYRTVSKRLEEHRERLRNAQREKDLLDDDLLLDYPTYSGSDLPRTRFSCKNKVNGGYYADIETNCQMYHICYRDENGVMRSNKFLCGNGTVFEQRHLVCQDYQKVRRCGDSRAHYRVHAARSLKPLPGRMGGMRREEEIPETDDSPLYYPTYSESDLPRTGFSCADKVHGGYYADIETDCQMYHICSRDKYGIIRSNRFLCGNGTVFDQRHLVCQSYQKVRRCQESGKYYRNVATLLELLEKRLRNEQSEKKILEAADFPFARRLK